MHNSWLQRSRSQSLPCLFCTTCLLSATCLCSANCLFSATCLFCAACHCRACFVPPALDPPHAGRQVGVAVALCLLGVSPITQAAATTCRWNKLQTPCATSPTQVNGGELPPHVIPFAVAGALLAALVPLASRALDTLLEGHDYDPHHLRTHQRHQQHQQRQQPAYSPLDATDVPISADSTGAGGGGSMRAAGRGGLMGWLMGAWQWVSGDPHRAPTAPAVDALGASSRDAGAHPQQRLHGPWLVAARCARLLMPSSVGVAVGMYVSPKWTLPRVLGSLVEQAWRGGAPDSHEALMVVVASGLVLGEGTASMLAALAKAAGL